MSGLLVAAGSLQRRERLTDRSCVTMCGGCPKQYFFLIVFILSFLTISIETQRNGLMLIVNLLGTPYAHMDRRLATEILDLLQVRISCVCLF